MKLIEAVLVDFDGTLANTEHANTEAYLKSLTDADFNFTHDDIKNIITGRHWTEFLPDLLGHNYSRALGEEIAKNKKIYYKNQLENIKLNTSLLKFIESFGGKLSKGIVSNASRESIHTILDFYRLSNYFDVIISGEDVVNHKPNPEGYLKALSSLGVLNTKCLAIEDSDIGVLAAERANIPVMKIAPF